MGLALEFKGGRIFQETLRLAPHNVKNLLGGKGLAQSLFAQGVGQQECGFDAHVGLDEVFFQLFQGFVGNFAGAYNALELAHEGVTGLGKAALDGRKKSHYTRLSTLSTRP